MPATSIIYSQNDFSGGMNLLSLDTQLAPNQYRIGINLRSRFGYLKPVRNVIEVNEGLEGVTGSNQGLYAIGNILVLFNGGTAYYKTTSSDTWTIVAGLSMDISVERIYACAVPQASLVYNRVNAGATPSAGVTLNNITTTPNPVCLVVQDGINQPWLIFADGTARLAKNYSQWTTTDREYVPIGRQMVFFNGILFIVSADGKRIYRSVTGRPLDFVVAVDNASAKVANAESTSFAVDSNEIKMLTQLNTDSLIAITSYSAYAVQLNIDSLIYGEPTFNQTFLFSAGVVNQFSFADILGDFAFIDREGLKSFNAVYQLRFEGNNSVFSLSIAELFKGIIQTNPCVGSFDNYTFFSVKTTYSPNSILVFDNIKKVFSSLDVLTPQPIIQFAVTYDSSVQRIFGLTTNDVYELYSEEAEGYKEAIVFTRAFDSKNGDNGPTIGIGNIRASGVMLIFEENEDEDAQFVFNEIVNDQFIQPTSTGSQTRNIPVYTGGVYYPVTAPVIASVTNFTVPFNIPYDGREGQKIEYSILWTGGSNLRYFQADLLSRKAPTTKQQQTLQYA